MENKNIKGKSYGHEFYRQVLINVFITYCHELRLAIDIDGSSNDYNFENDENRQINLEDLGINIIRFEDKDIKYHINDVLRALEITISELEWENKV